MLASVPDEPPSKLRARTPGPCRDDWPGDKWRVGLLSPDPDNPPPVFSPPNKPRGAPADDKDKDKDKETGWPVAPALDEKVSGRPAALEPEKREVEYAPAVGGRKQGQEQVSGGDTDTESAEEDEVFEMTSMDNIRVTLPEYEAAARYVQHQLTRDFGGLIFCLQRRWRWEDCAPEKEKSGGCR